MKAMRNLGVVLAGLLLGSLGCEGPAAVPAKPTWVDDVEPILRASCFSCHGAVSPENAPSAARWDFYDMGEPRLTTINNFTPTEADKFRWPSAKDHAINWTAYITAAPNATNRMPPAPATPLSANALQTILNWIATGTFPPPPAVGVPPLRGMRLHNNKPTAAWLVKPTTIVVSDDDHEQVLGKVTCQGADQPIFSSGTTKLPTGWQPPCTATLFDGQDVVTVNLP